MEYIYYLASLIDTSSLPRTQANTNTTISVVLNLVFAFAASIALLMIVISGFRYIAAHGDPSATAQARNGLLYSFVGLIVTMVAYSIVLFVVKSV